MKVLDNAERYLDDFLSNMREKEVSTPQLSLSQLAQDLKKHDEFTGDTEDVLLLISSRRFTIHFVSKGFALFSGYSQEEVMDFKPIHVFKSFKLDSLNYPLSAFLWNDGIKSNFNSPPIQHKTFSAGIECKRKDGEVYKLFIKQIGLEFDSKNNPTASLLRFKKINHLMKKDFFWMRVIEGEDGETKGFFTTKTGKTKYRDAFSNREMEVLRLLERNKNTKEISQLLGITTNTVEKHRKNMIARLGAKDSTALIQLCQMCEII